MSDEDITIMSREELVLRRQESKTNWERLMRDQAAGIEPEIDPDEGEFDWSRAEVVIPPSKSTVTLRLDDDVLDFFRRQDQGCQTSINAVLRSYMKARQA